METIGLYKLTKNITFTITINNMEININKNISQNIVKKQPTMKKIYNVFLDKYCLYDEQSYVLL